MIKPKTRDEALGLLFGEIKKIKHIFYIQCVLYDNIRTDVSTDKTICGDICPFADGDSCILKNIYLYYNQVAAFSEPVAEEPTEPEQIPVNPEDLEIG